LGVQTEGIGVAMELGAFSVSLNVKDIHQSFDFYQKLGFKVFGGDIDQNWLILKNGETVIGLFQGMFDKNMLTFNPGWDNSGQDTESFDDIRTIEELLLQQGVALDATTASATGPAHVMLTDPDGNPILIDQHRAS
jgi:catechol 2,3-dioxygenase-like lactoylglutathione lyase family enzyme